MINERNAYAYCKEDISKIENYDKAIADTTQTWVCHHRTEIWWNCTAQDLIDNQCYYNRKACELIFLTNSEHASIHKPFKNRVFTDEYRRKLSEAKKGIKRPKSVCNKISKAVKGHKYNLINGVRVRNKEVD